MTESLSGGGSELNRPPPPLFPLCLVSTGRDFDCSQVGRLEFSVFSTLHSAFWLCFLEAISGH